MLHSVGLLPSAKLHLFVKQEKVVLLLEMSLVDLGVAVE